MKKSPSVEAFVVPIDDSKNSLAPEPIGWYPLRLRFRTKESLSLLQDIIKETISVRITEEDNETLYVYGYRPFESLLKTLPVQFFSELHIDRQSAYFFEVDSLDSQQKAREVEAVLMAPNQNSIVNAAVADPINKTICVFANQIPKIDSKEIIQVSLTIEWAFFAAMNGRTKFRKVLDTAAQYIGVYPPIGCQLQLSRIHSLLTEKAQSAGYGVMVNIVQFPPSIQVNFAETISCSEMQSHVLSVLRDVGFTCELTPCRVVLWQKLDDILPCIQTDFSRKSTSSIAPNSVGDLKKSVNNALQPIGLNARLREVQYATFHIGSSKGHLWQLCNNLKKGMEPLQEHIYAVFVDFTATQLTVATPHREVIVSAVPQTLKKLGFTCAQLKDSIVKVTDNALLLPDLEWVSQFRKGRRSRSPPFSLSNHVDISNFPITAVKLAKYAPGGLEEYVQLQKPKGVEACAIDEEQQICYIRHLPSLTSDTICDIFVLLGYDSAILPFSPDFEQRLETLLTHRQLEECLEENSVTTHGVELLDQVAPKIKSRTHILSEQHYQDNGSMTSSNRMCTPLTPRSRLSSSGYEPVVSVALKAKRKDDDGASSCPTETSEIYLSVFAHHEDDDFDDNLADDQSLSGFDEVDQVNLGPRSASDMDLPRLIKEPVNSQKRSRSLSPCLTSNSSHRERETLFMVLEPSQQEPPPTTEDDVFIPECKSGMSEASLDNMYYFEHEWCFWFSVQDTDDNLTEIGSFDTVQGFWRYWNALDVHHLRDGCSLRLFKKNVKPRPEDPMNKEGGKWIATGVDQTDRFRMWSNIVLAVVGEMLCDNTDNTVCGVTMITRAGGDILQLWVDGGYYHRTQTSEPPPLVTTDSMDVALQKLLWPEITDKTYFTYTPHFPSTHATLNVRQIPTQTRSAPTPAKEQDNSKCVKEQKRDQVRNWLVSINLEDYFDALVADGYDDMRSVIALEEADLDDLGFKKGHKRRFLMAKSEYNESTPIVEPVHSPSLTAVAVSPATTNAIKKEIISSETISALPNSLGITIEKPTPSTIPIQQSLAAFQQAQTGAPYLPTVESNFFFPFTSIINEKQQNHTTLQNTTSARQPTLNNNNTPKLNPQAPAFTGYIDRQDSKEDESHTEKKFKFGWRDIKNGREWREMEWDSIPEDERHELWERMEERTAVEIDTASQELLKQVFPMPQADWQTLGKFVFLRNGTSSMPLPDGRKVGEQVSLLLSGVGDNPRLLALKFDGIVSENGTPHIVLYKSNCTRQEESNYIQNWSPPPRSLVVNGIIKRVWRMRQQKRTNNNRKKRDAFGFPSSQPPISSAPTSTPNQVTNHVVHHVQGRTPPAKPQSNNWQKDGYNYQPHSIVQRGPVAPGAFGSHQTRNEYTPPSMATTQSRFPPQHTNTAVRPPRPPPPVPSFQPPWNSF